MSVKVANDVDFGGRRARSLTNVTDELGAFVGSGGTPGGTATDWRTGLSEITITTNSTQAIQNAIDAAGPTGRKIIFPASLGTYVPTDWLSITGKENIALTGINNPLWQTNQGNFGFVRLLGNNKNIDITNLKLSNTLISNEVPDVSLIHGYEQGPNLSIRLANLELTAPNVAQNTITFTPFSPLNESGNGVGNLLNDLLMEYCYLHDVGRCAIEINTHVYKDNRFDSFLNNAIIRYNRFSRIGGKDNTNTIPTLTFGGVQRNGQIYENTITDGTYAGIELVSSQGYRCWNNRFLTTNGWINQMSAYAISENPGRPTQDIEIRGGGGYVKGRAFLLQDIVGLRVIGGNYFSDKFQSVQRITDGSFDNVNVKVVTGYSPTTADGGNVMQIRDTENFHILGGTYELTAQSGQTPYSVINYPSGGTNVNSSIVGATLKRPAGSQDDIVHVEGNTQLNESQNTKIN